MHQTGRPRPGCRRPSRPPPRHTLFVHHFSDALRDRFLTDLGSIFWPKWPPKTLQNPPKFDAKRHYILGFKFWSIFDRFFFDFAIFRRPGKALRYYKYNSFVAFTFLIAKCTNYQKFIPNEVKKTTFSIIISIFSIQVPIFKGIKNSIDVGIDFCALWAPT